MYSGYLIQPWNINEEFVLSVKRNILRIRIYKLLIWSKRHLSQLTTVVSSVQKTNDTFNFLWLKKWQLLAKYIFFYSLKQLFLYVVHSQTHYPNKKESSFNEIGFRTSKIYSPVVIATSLFGAMLQQLTLLPKKSSIHSLVNLYKMGVKIKYPLRTYYLNADNNTFFR